MTPRIALIAAADAGNVIGRDGGLPWHLPGDLRQFQRATHGHPVVVGRTTRDSLPGGHLPGRELIVVTRRPDAVTGPGVRAFADLERALDHARQRARALGLARLWVAGGASVYAQCLPIADEVRLSRIHASIPGDAVFPDLDPATWLRIDAEAHPAAGSRPAWTLETYQRR
jgi:dihydrofolate reductase